MAFTYNKSNCVMGGCGDFDDAGLIVSIASTLALTADDVLWSGLREGRVRGFGGDTCSRCMVLRDLIIGPVEAPVLNDLPLWEL